jgi:hypothetical protein
MSGIKKTMEANILKTPVARNANPVLSKKVLLTNNKKE